MVKLSLYNKNNKKEMIKLIKGFWLAHNNYNQSDEEANIDLLNWTKDGHLLYFINYEEKNVGFIHLGSRGCKIDWLEDIYVLPNYQNKGIGTSAIKIVEDIVKTYSDSLYIEAASRNYRAIKLYKSLGYDCLNTITVRKDFNKEDFDVISKVNIFDNEFQIKKEKDNN